jgi:hypothetical protein
MVGANDHGDEAQNGLWSFLSKHSHCGGDREKLHSPRPAQLAGHIDLKGRIKFVRRRNGT